ncbi:Pep3/Vps18/deep orange family protein [Besnoitia besnoiti]|uniref:Pep3/Vps18/deep orange family protein n=1 Tax=Besnoitia besnoiti TaxID=94643 RepID=A0A2A9M9P5_BESBE|nr:Pep3/Vps18/deep orange family protein [Besnoitia besnoiti]PFH32092.1 Pep3/Vps18/deep orange family protein [Besnoitia besnoiti]
MPPPPRGACGFASLAFSALAEPEVEESGPSFTPRVLRIYNDSSLKARGGIVSVAAASRCLYVACLNGDLIRWHPDENEGALIEFPSPKPAERREIRRVFLDSKGFHCLVAMANGDNYYVHFSSEQARLLPRLKDHFVESVAWNKQATETSTRDFVIGTRHGAIVECLFESGKDRYVHPLLQFPKRTPVLDVRLEVLPWAGGAQRQLLLAATLRHLYLFPGNPNLSATLQNLSLSSSSTSPTDLKLFLAFEVPKESPSGGPVLQLVKKKGGRDLLLFWTTGIGVVSSTLHLWAPSAEHGDASLPDARSFFSQEPPSVLAFPRQENSLAPGGFGAEAEKERRAKGERRSDEESLLLPASSGTAPLSVLVTDFHVLMLYGGKLVALSRITEKTVLEVPFSAVKYGVVRRLLQDPFDGGVFLYTDTFVCQIVISNESAQAWRLYLEQGKFALALSHCATAAQRERVVVSQANWQLGRGRFVEAAELLAQAQSVPFEEVCLFFFAHRQTLALRSFFLSRYKQLANAVGPGSGLFFGARAPPGAIERDDHANGLRSTAAPTPQQVMLFVWIVELLLHELAQLDAALLRRLRRKGEKTSQQGREDATEGRGSDDGGGGENHEEEREREVELLKEKKKETGDQLRRLLADFRGVDEIRATVYALLQAHGRFDELHHFAELCGDLESVVIHYLSRRDYATVIEKLACMSDFPLRDSLLYRLSPLLFRHEPRAFTAMCISPAFAHIDPSKLLPALLHCRGADRETMRAQAPDDGLRDAQGSTREGCAERRECALELLIHFARLATPFKSGAAAGGDSAWLGARGGGVSSRLPLATQKRFLSSGPHSVGETHGRWKGLSGLWNALIVFKAEAEDETDLLRLLAAQKPGHLPFDPQFALRFCLEKGRERSAVLLYGLLGLHTEAVEKALATNDMTLGQHAANAPADPSQRQQLWLRLAHHAALHEDVPALVALVKRSGNLLKIQDVLPYISDSTVIDTLKEEICASLDAYEQRIASRFQEMETHKEAIASLKDELRTVNQRCVVVEVDQICDVCCESIFTERFYAFCCGHCFHASCCQRLLVPAMDVDTLAEFERRMVDLDRALEHGASAEELEQLENAVDDILAAECSICGTLMIRSIALPFIGPGESVEEINSWSIVEETPSREADGKD